jgi:heme-degrading monooxygenase HmoA
VDIVIGRVPVPPAVSEVWEEAFHRRVQTAKRHKGWRGVDLCVPTDDASSRIILGKWASMVDYDAWARSPDYLRSVEEMQNLQAGAPNTEWCSVVWSEAAPWA